MIKQFITQNVTMGRQENICSIKVTYSRVVNVEFTFQYPVASNVTVLIE